MSDLYLDFVRQIRFVKLRIALDQLSFNAIDFHVVFHGFGVKVMFDEVFVLQEKLHVLGMGIVSGLASGISASRESYSLEATSCCILGGQRHASDCCHESIQHFAWTCSES